MPFPKQAWARAALLLCASWLAGCGDPIPIESSPPDPPGARDDAYLPFHEPLRSELVRATTDLRQRLAPKAECLNARILRVPARDAARLRQHYSDAVGPDWSPIDLAPPALATSFAFRNGRLIFAAVVPRSVQNGWAGAAIVTNTAWDPDSRRTLMHCIAERR